MVGVELNIMNRGYTDTQWNAGKGKITIDDLEGVKEQRTDSSGALNALPTPFARFFVVKEAFRRMRGDAGRAYESLVSDCLDLFELLFYIDYHTKRGIKISLATWDIQSGIREMQKATPVLGDSIRDYWKEDLGMSASQVYFVFLIHGNKKYLLGTSSPMTGFVTPPDLDKHFYNKDSYTFVGSRYENDGQKIPNIKRKEGGKYFDGQLPFEKRTKEFKNYLYGLLSDVVDIKQKEIRDYIRLFEQDEDIVDNFAMSTEELHVDGDPIIINGLKLMKSVAIEEGLFLSDKIIKLPFRISELNFKMPKLINMDESRTYDYLYPLTKEALATLDISKLECTMQQRKGAVKVRLKCGAVDVTKTYEEVRTGSDNGSIVDISNHDKILFDLGFFPKIKSLKPEENNYFKIMLAVRDANAVPDRSDERIHLSFYRQKNDGKEQGLIRIEEAKDGMLFENGVRVSKYRSVQDKNSEKELASTRFYELFNTDFDAIYVDFDEGVSGGVLFPNWKVQNVVKRIFRYAIDLGTSNTFISRCEVNGNKNTPEQMRMTEPIMAYLHAKQGSVQLPEVERWEYDVDEILLNYFQTEFLPPLIDGKIKYKFPIRTALCYSDRTADKPRLFDNTNIAFSYERQQIAAGQKVLTDIKWNASSEKYIRLFIHELLLLIKSQILMDNGDLSKTEIVWFAPLSFNNKIKGMFRKVWSEEVRTILSSENVKLMSESEAPYHYFRDRDSYKGIEAVSIIDIGGGSTDYVYFSKGKAELASSIQLGCDVLWGSGLDKAKDAKNNGIYKAFANSIHFNDEVLDCINKEMMNPDSQRSTKDIINFWINKSDKTNLNNMLEANFKPLFLYHYTTVIYYLARICKIKGLNCPSDITFCGNGSRYIDQYLTNDFDLLSKITSHILGGVFQTTIDKVNLILPDERKECTCYGGLHGEISSNKVETFNLIGFDDTHYRTLAELNKALEGNLKKLIVQDIENLNKLYIDVLRIIKSELGIQCNIDKIKEIINKDLESSVVKYFQTEIVSGSDMETEPNESLLIYPIIDKLFQLSNLK